MAARRLLPSFLCNLHLVRAAGLLGLGAEVGRGRARLGEIAAEDGVDEGAEDHLGATT